MVRFTPRTFTLSALAVSAALLAGCAGGYGYDYGGYGGYSAPPSDGPMSNREAARLAYEQNLERRVSAALQSDPRVGSGITVTSQGDGVVMLGGSPANGVAGRDLALAIARSVPGVRRVANNMVMN